MFNRKRDIELLRKQLYELEKKYSSLNHSYMMLSKKLNEYELKHDIERFKGDISHVDLKVNSYRVDLYKAIFRATTKPKYKVGDKVKGGIIKECRVLQIGGGDTCNFDTWEYDYYVVDENYNGRYIYEGDLLLINNK